MTRAPHVVALALAAGLGGGELGCDRAHAEPTVPPRPVEARPESLQAFITAEGRAATQDEAYAAARVRLAEALFGDARWLDLVALELHEPTGDPMLVTEQPDAVQVQIGLSRERAAALVGAFELADPKVRGPEVWTSVLYAYVFAHKAELACSRRRELFAVECEPPETAEADEELRALAAGVTLAPLHDGGVPVDAQGRPLRAPGVFVFWHGVPVVGAPVVASMASVASVASDGDREPLRVETGPDGTALVVLDEGAQPGFPIEFALDTDAMLGPLAESWRGRSLGIDTRSVGFRRWGIAMSTEDISTEAFERSIARALDLSDSKPLEVPSGRVERFESLADESRREQIKALADAMTGRLDLLVVIRPRAEFAGRMDRSRVWYEATASVRAFDAWTGRVLTEFAAAEKASGVGDARARSAALERLAETVARKLAEGLEPAKARVSARMSRTESGR